MGGDCLCKCPGDRPLSAPQGVTCSLQSRGGAERVGAERLRFCSRQPSLCNLGQTTMALGLKLLVAVTSRGFIPNKRTRGA